MYKISFEGRNSSHEGSNARVIMGNQELGVNCGLSNLIAYQVRGFEHDEVRPFTLIYEDGAYLGPFLGVLRSEKRGENRVYVLTHVSHDGSEWRAVLSKN